jgi:2'-5' RNA ligase
MRLFVAVPVPTGVANVLAGVERPVVDGLRWTTPDQWHVTIVFFGEVPDDLPLREALQGLPALVTGLHAVLGPVTAWFPGRRVLHVPVRGVDPLAAAVQRVIGGVTEISGLSVDPRPFVGHLTLARVRGARPGPARLAGVPVQATWPVESVALMASTLGPGGARYETLDSVALAP